MLRTRVIRLALAALLLAGLFASAHAQEDSSTYGTYQKGSVKGAYGQKRPVNTIEEARKVLDEFFKEKGVRVGSIKERKLFFEADVLDEKDIQTDRVILDKRTGRIRSIY